VGYAVGARPPVRGLAAVIAINADQGRLTCRDRHSFRAAWAGEVESHFTRVADGRRLSFPCTDIYRFQDGKIRDQRVYADMSPLFEDWRRRRNALRRRTPPFPREQQLTVF
jgi:ketosteroid isomerase-like protein